MLKIVDINNTLLAYLNNVINPSISEKINNSYTLTFSCVIEDLKTDYIQYGNRIQAENQLFNIVTYSKERTNNNKLLCSVYCEHVSYELIDDSILFDYYNITATQALGYALQGTNFNLGNVSDLGTNTFQRDEEEINRRAMLFSIAKAYNGELYFNNFEVSLFSMRGANNGVQIRVGKNLKGIRQTVDGKKKDSEGNPFVSYEIDFIELEQLDIYKGLETVRLGDTIKVIDEGLRIEVAARILEYEYDPILKRNSRVVLGNFVEDIASYNSTVKKTVDEVESMKDIWNRSESIKVNDSGLLKYYLDTSQAEVRAGLGSVRITDNNGIMILDNPDESLATKALRLLGGVLAISNEKDQSGEWVWRTFGTGDGFIADEIISGTIWTNLISIVGNSDNPNAFKWDSNGLKVHKINPDNTIDYDQYIILDQSGLRFTKDRGVTWIINIGFDVNNVATKDTVVEQNVEYNSVKIGSDIGVKATHVDGSYTQMTGDGMLRYVPQPIYSESSIPANKESFTGKTITNLINEGWEFLNTGEINANGYSGSCLRIGFYEATSWARKSFYVSKDNAAFNFRYKTLTDNSDYKVVVDGNSTTLNQTATWALWSTTLNKGWHYVQFECYLDSGDDPDMYIDEVIFEANPVEFIETGQTTVGKSYNYVTYIGYGMTYGDYSQGSNYEPYDLNWIPDVWVDLPEEFKNKDFQVFLGLKDTGNYDQNRFINKIELDVIEVDYVNARFKVRGRIGYGITFQNTAFDGSTYTDYRVSVKGLEFTYFVTY